MSLPIISAKDAIIRKDELPLSPDGTPRGKIRDLRREVGERMWSRCLLAVLLLSLQEIHARGGEPSGPSAPRAANSPGFFGRIRDRWIQRTQGLTPPSSPATQPAVPSAPVQ